MVFQECVALKPPTIIGEMMVAKIAEKQDDLGRETPPRMQVTTRIVIIFVAGRPCKPSFLICLPLLLDGGASQIYTALLLL